MKRTITITLLVAALSLVSRNRADAGLMFSLHPDADLSSLFPGQVVTFDVNLAGLVTGDELDFLTATVEFDPLLLGTPTISVPPTPIAVFDPFFTRSEPGLAEVAYLAPFDGPPITQDGAFFSFSAQVLGPGTGMIGFTRVEAIASPFSATPHLVSASSMGPQALDDFASDPLQISSVPEPSSFALLAMGAASLCGWRLRSRRARARRHTATC
jgi:PEP-CTERM motif